ncbi:MAG TPA: hypothetical protein VIY48_10115, partial [Candidatus Paceibacterota bacterium]
PIGARHFAAQARLVQNLVTLMNSPLGQDDAVKAHLSGKKMAKMFEELLGLEKFALYEENVRIYEAIDTQRAMRTGENSLAEEDMVDTEPPPVEPQ